MNDMMEFYTADNNAAGPNGQYMVTSIYYDSHFRNAYFEKVEGLPNRQKLRFRYYNGDWKNGGKWELKERRAAKTSKILMDEFMKNKGSRDLKPSSCVAGKSYRPEMPTIANLIPFVVIRYQRQAFINRYQENTRLTIDSDVWCMKYSNYALGSDIWTRSLNAHQNIVEFKPEHTMSFCDRFLIKKYQLQMRAISKYGAAVKRQAVNSSMNAK